MDYIKFPLNFGELHDKYSNYSSSKVVILPMPFEKTTTFMKGTKNGPKAVISASRHMELFDDELNKNVCEVGICTLPEFVIKDYGEKAIEKINNEISKILSDKKFPIILGGEHSITAGSVKAFSEKVNNLSVLQLDAHADLREKFEGSEFNHACTMKRCYDYCDNIVQVGIRSLSYEESEYLKKKKLRIYYAMDIYDNERWFESVIGKLNDNVYMTIDLDVFDPSIMPSVGTPEPGGLFYYPVLKFLKRLCEKKNLMGVDIVELKPDRNIKAPDFFAAKLIYKIIGYKFQLEN